MIDSIENKLGLSYELQSDLGAVNTAREICQQPDVWRLTYQKILEEKVLISEFLKDAYAFDDLKIILTGAGTSAYIGDILSQSFQQIVGKNTWAFATTDLVTHPQQYFGAEDTLLLVSFARSGNSPESVAVVELAESLCRRVYHLVVTCNEGGELVRVAQEKKSYVVFLPEETNDKALAMTSSFTSMLLTGILVSRIDRLEDCKRQVDRLIKCADIFLLNEVEGLKTVSAMGFDRAVFLGSGPLRGAACESQLKLQELTGGQVICKFDSYLGVRHGPKVVIDNKTLVVFIFSNDRHARNYEVDLVKSVNASGSGLYLVGIGEDSSSDLDLDLYVSLSSDGEVVLEDDFLAIVSVLPAQVMGFYKAIELGLLPDSPSVDGVISRVVKGVNIYPFEI
ncbi:SIS domain-containing protein [Sphingobacterium pedocola]|uniref:Sugar isomerase n=1 Tax=Sphingobacterium pedocola TaxID=2082722 RepID=A0ABR9TDZ5_9SPHI|nr:SIS domain-containing protein [Sphingobacterium pedocola]MBE8723267.1 sugar isomerase [Sphingobacterium pedocola]